jgi:hypothetical protein
MKRATSSEALPQPAAATSAHTDTSRMSMARTVRFDAMFGARDTPPAEGRHSTELSSMTR